MDHVAVSMWNDRGLGYLAYWHLHALAANPSLRSAQAFSFALKGLKKWGQFVLPKAG